MDYSHEQATHDEVNLIRLVRRLEKSILTENDWDEAAATQQERVWFKALGTLQKVKYGRKLLRNLEQYDTDPTTKKSRQRRDVKTNLDRIELFMTEVQTRTAPINVQPESFLSKIPEPESPLLVEALSPPNADEQLAGPHAQIQGDILEPPRNAATTIDPSNNTNLLSPHNTPPHDSSPIVSLLPTTPSITPQPRPTFLATSTALDSSSHSNTTTARKHLQNSSALHEDLSAQLAQMATQLKRNAIHFSDSLATDKAVVEETQVKLEANFGVMLKERLRLRDFRGKSGSTTCLTIGVVVAVLVLFMFMVSIIRLSGR